MNMKHILLLSALIYIFSPGLLAKTYSYPGNNLQAKVNYPSERTRERSSDRNQRSTHSYMYVNPFFEDYYSNYYDNDGTQFYFFYQKDDPTYESNEIPQNYNNDTDYSTTRNDSRTD